MFQLTDVWMKILMTPIATGLQIVFNVCVMKY